jgi:hypothetical protein
MGADLAELNLLKYKNTCDDAETKIHKAFLNKALALHPDRGGTRPAFQHAVNAFERLKHRLKKNAIPLLKLTNLLTIMVAMKRKKNTGTMSIISSFSGPGSTILETLRSIKCISKTGIDSKL